MFAKLYLCLKYRKKIKSINKLTRPLNIYKKQTTQIAL